MKEKVFFAAYLVLFVSRFSEAQVPVADFTAPALVCMGELFQVENSSVGDRYEWDFCQGDLLLTPTVQQGVIATGNTTLGIDVVFDGTAWFGFVTDAGNNTIVRLTYGSDLNSTPVVTSLGAIFSSSVVPYDIKVVYHNGEWFGFVYGVSQLITRLDFGNSLTNIPTSSMVISGNGTTSGLDVLYSNGEWYIIFTQNFFVTVVQLSDIRDTPTIANIKTTSLTDSNVRLGDIKIVKSGTDWYGYSVCYATKKLFRFSFGSDLFSIAGVTEISGGVIGSFTPFGIDGAIDNGLYTLFISTLEGNLIRVNLGADLTLPPIEEFNLGTFGLLNSTLKVTLVKSGSSWRAFSLKYTSGDLFNVRFSDPLCTGNQVSSVNETPELVFSGVGTEHITLRSFIGGAYSEVSQKVTVQNLAAPVIGIVAVGNCISSAVQFNYSSDQPATEVLWDFQNGQTSTNESPDFLFVSPGNHDVALTLTAANGCSNLTRTEVSIFNPPSADFQLPSGFTCTNNEILFANTTADSFDGNLSYEWFVDGSTVSMERDLTYTFPAIGIKDIELIASIPGCSSAVAKSFIVDEIGPAVDFSVHGICQQRPIEFTNLTSGSVTSLEWDFGDGEASIEQTPIHTYELNGTYQVSLTAINEEGCKNSKTNSLIIYSRPQTDFSIDLPPFSCAGSPSQFNDLTPPLSDSNITTWAWGFGDAANGSSTQRNPTYTYSLAGDYQVSLSTTTNFGCTASIQKQVTISTAPAVDFTNAVACLNQGTQFTDASDPTAKAWLWSIQNSTYTTKDPTHVFSATGSQPVMLTVTGNNNCVSQITKTVSVPIPAVPDFTAISTCAGKPTVFQEKNPGGNDPAVSWSWDFGGQGTGTGSPTEHTFLDVDSYTVKMNSTRQSGCVYSVTKSVSISQSPHAQFSPSPETGGSPLTVGFTNTSSLATSYLWKFKDADNSTSTEFSPSFIFNQLGEYPVELIASNALGCQDSFTKMIQVVVPNVNAVLTEFKLTPSGGGSLKATITIKNEGNISMSNPDVIIDLSGNASVKEKLVATIAPNQSLTRTLSLDILSKNLKYTCAELNTAGDKYLFDNRQCINLETEIIPIQPYPNPTQDELFIDWINAGSESMHVVIYNASGQIVLDRKYEPVLTGLNQIEVNVSNLGAGIYFVTYFDGSVSRTSRFSIVR